MLTCDKDFPATGPRLFFCLWQTAIVSARAGILTAEDAYLPGSQLSRFSFTLQSEFEAHEMS